MKTPIYDFVTRYAESGASRMHMPGHKGIGDIERFDITEVFGADSLYEANGIIRESEKYAGELFGADTFYSAEGSSLSIRAMMYLVRLYSKTNGRPCKILAARNVHKSFVSAVGLLDIDVEWLLPNENESYLSSSLDGAFVERALLAMDEPPPAVYVTSPEYLGRTLPIADIAEVCHRYGVLLLVDNAHGAYLKFLNPSRHPIDLGADICCDSAHKTLPVLTGGAYLHISRAAPAHLSENAKRALALFGSTSPSYLILASLDRANAYIAGGYRERLAEFSAKVDRLKSEILNNGYALFGDEPLKLTLLTKKYGYLGYELAERLMLDGIVCEFCDPDHLVLMLTPENTDEDISKLKRALLSIERREEIAALPPKTIMPMRKVSVREALLSACVSVSPRDAAGRVLASVTVGCPPAVPIIISGEVIDDECISAFEYYGIDEVNVIY